MMKNLPTFCDDFDRNLALPAMRLSERSVIHPLVYHHVSVYKKVQHPWSEVSRTFEQTRILWEGTLKRQSPEVHMPGIVVDSCSLKNIEASVVQSEKTLGRSTQGRAVSMAWHLQSI
jgi:hypothetical protein